MSASCTMHRFVCGAGVLVRLAGRIDETFDAERLVALTQGARVVVFDLDRVRGMTSYGIREWMTALSLVGAPYYGYVRCRPAVVSQFNMIDGFSQRGELVTLYAPYACDECGGELDCLVDLRRDYERVKADDVPDVACVACGGVARFDDVPEIYFDYVRDNDKPTPPAGAAQLLDGDGASAPGEGFKLRKVIAGDVTAFWMSGALQRAGHFRRAAEGVDGHCVVVADRLSCATGAGLSDLVGFLAAPRLGAYLAGVPRGLVATMAEALAPATVRVVSVSLPFYCPACEDVGERDVDMKGLWAVSECRPHRCQSCRGVLVPLFSGDELSRARSLVSSLAPPPIAKYLSGVRAPAAGAREGEASDDFVGKYRVVRRLGVGGMGEVSLAHQTGPENFQRTVVVKQIRSDLPAHNRRMLDSLLAEARIAARLSHPNIVQVLELGECAGEYFIAMEYVNGVDLSRLLQHVTHAGRAVPIACACRIASDVCAGLHAAHTFEDEGGQARPVVHRDVSPSNVLVSLDGVVKLADFGIAKVADAADATAPGVFKGKTGYASPEQLLGANVDGRSDLYAVGVILFEMLTKRRLRRRGEQAPRLEDLRRARGVRGLRSDAPVALDAIVRRALAFDLGERFGSARELRNELEAVLRDVGYVTAEDLGEWVRGVLAADRLASGSRRGHAVVESTTAATATGGREREARGSSR